MRLPSTDDGVRLQPHGPVKRPEDRIVLQHVRERLGVGEIVRGDEFDIGVVQAGANDVSSDAAEAVDPYFDCHRMSPLLLFRFPAARMGHPAVRFYLRGAIRPGFR